jgi:dipeptidyl aminopeptidase/acylaminoacyl peptidase
MRDGNSEIYSMNAADGSGAKRLTNDAATDVDPDWSPLGTSIAFSSSRDGDYEIWSMNTDGTVPTQLTKNTVCDFSPRWSPDARKIAFEEGPQCTGPNEIESMNTDGSGIVDLSNDASNDVDPAWSPDGTKIAFASNRDGDYEIWSMNANGSSPVKLTTRTTTGRGKRNPDWQTGNGGGGGGSFQPDGRIKLSGQSSYVGDNVYNLTGTGQTVTAKSATGTSTTWVINDQNDGGSIDSFLLKGPGNRTGFTVHYFAGTTGTTDITTAVVNGTYQLTNIPFGSARTVRIVVHVKAGVPVDTIRSWLVVATSTGDATKQDAVKARIRVA